MRQSHPLARAGLCIATIAASFAGCRCNEENLGRNFGEITVIWRDEGGNRILNRDATLDFGLALVGDRKTTLATGNPATLVLSNTGSNKLTLDALEWVEGDDVVIGALGEPTETSQFEVAFESLELGSQTQHEFPLAFTPRQTRNAFLSKLRLTTSGTRTEDSEVLLTLKGQGDLSACELPSVINFGKTAQGETITFTVPFKNPTRIEATGEAGAIEGLDAASFGYRAPSAAGPVVVPAETTADVVLTFSPTELRTYEATVSMRGPGECPAQTVTLRGEGSDETLTWTPEVIDYGYVNPGEEIVREVVFSNPASVPVTLTNVTSSDPDNFYVVPSTSTFEVAPDNAPTALRVACNPNSLGIKLGVITFDTGLTQTPSGTITLRCTGGGPRIQVQPRPTLSFGRVGFFPASPNFSVQRKVNVRNVGVQANEPDAGTGANLFLGEVIDDVPGNLPLFSVAGPDAQEFTVSLSSTPAYDPAVGLRAQVGQNFTDITVTLRPGSVGQKSAALNIYSNDSQEPTVTVNITADVQQPPPCNFTVMPAPATGLNFGLVSSGVTKDLPIIITNSSSTPGDICYLTGIELGAGSDLAYSIVGGNITEHELLPGQSLEVVVRVAPTGQQPAQLISLTGALVFNSTSATMNNVAVPLTTAVGPTCLTVSPDPMDFGTVRLSCYSARRTFSIYNTCTTPVQINGINMQAAAGQHPFPAAIVDTLTVLDAVRGGTLGLATEPAAPGSAPCPEFHLTQLPSLPATLAPGGAPITFQANYGPLDVGTDSGAIAISVVQGQSITYLVGLQGAGSTTGTQVDTFTQDLIPKADVLLVVDDSCSMQDKQNALAANFANFIQYAQSANVDYRIGVTTTTIGGTECVPIFGCFTPDSRGPNGHLVQDGPTQLKWVTPQTPQVSSVFSRLVNVGTNGGTEQPLAGATLALTPPAISNENAGFLRDEANLAVVVISDASDQSPRPVTYYQDLLVNVKGYQRLSYFTFSAVTPRLANPPSNCSYDESGANSSRYNPITSYTGGVQDEICNSNWAQTLQNLGQTAFGYRTHFYLENQPQGAVVVRIDGLVVPQCPAPTPGAQCWTYDAMPPAVRFANAPAPGDELEFEYTQNCYGP